jgi:penicillin-binding protein 2
MDYRDRWEHKEYLLERRLARRVTLFHVAIILLIVSYLLTFWYLQVIRGAEYAQLAENNRLRRIPMPPTRGVIFDRHSEVVASTRPSLNLVLRREGLKDAEGQLRRLETVLGAPYAELHAALQDMSARPTFEPLVVKEDVGLADLAKIEARREWFPSVEVEQTARRDYPDRQSVAHAVGYVGEVSENQLLNQPAEGTLELGDTVGKSGVERAYDDILRGRRGWKLVTVNSLGRQLGEAQNGRAPEDGRQLRLTLDLKLQRALMDAFGEEVGAGVFMDPWTGDVLALASSPAYDPNVFASHVSPGIWQSLVHDPRRPLQDRAIGSFYAPGSTFKVLMSIAGLESGVISPSTVLHCGGSINMYGRPFLCWKKGGHGAVDVHRALVQSCNVFFYQVGRMAGIETIARYADMLNIGRPTGIDLPGEATGVLPSPEWKMRTRGEPWYAGETISVSIGQGILGVTPIQMAVLMAGVSTGSLPRPHLVRSDRAPESKPLPISPGTLAIVRSALQDVVEEGTGKKASLGTISVAGKTGTAQVFKKSAGIDADKLPKDERDHAWFVGYAPADRPEIAFAVVVEHGGHGGTTAAPIVKKVLETFFADRLPPKQPPGALQAGLARPGEDKRDPAPLPR